MYYMQTAKNKSSLNQRMCTKSKIQNIHKYARYYTIFKCINCAHYTLWLYLY